jgi:hypothetical protein
MSRQLVYKPLPIGKHNWEHEADPPLKAAQTTRELGRGKENAEQGITVQLNKVGTTLPPHNSFDLPPHNSFDLTTGFTVFAAGVI